MRTHPDPIGHPAPAAGYEYTRFGRHRLRAPHGAVIDLPVPIHTDATVWVATIWPDPRLPAGWGRQVWALEPVAGRGWQLPHELAAGDIIEFGADTGARAVRWYGIMDSYEVDRWATIQGPYRHPTDAWDNAQRLLDRERFLEPLYPNPPEAVVTADVPPQARRERCPRTRHHQQRGGSTRI